MASVEELNELFKVALGESAGARMAAALDAWYLAKTGGTLTGGTISGTTTLSEAANIVAGTTTGSKIGTAVTQKLGFWNATPVVQPAHADQAVVAAITGGESPTEAEHNAVVTLLLAIRTALVNTGIIKGAA